MIIVGIDPSLTHTGYVVMEDKAVVLGSGVIKSKPLGDKPIDETIRISKIVEEVIEKIDSICTKGEPDMVVIEGLAFMARNTSSLVQLAGLNYLLRCTLNDLEWPFLIVAPTSLKKFITGSGKGDKDKMMMTVYKQYRFEAFDNNECDSFSLAVCGLAILGNPCRSLTVPQKEVIKLLEKQL